MPKKQKSSSSGSTRRKPWVDPDDAPELTDEMLDRAEISKGGRIIRPGRPPLDIQMRNAQLRLARKLKKA
ncbi:MAG TPA: hypothetical protein VN838_16535 [Bradyrhizobium sp.]|nr:hypothetical protein [Bradyrhizobium sp.]